MVARGAHLYYRGAFGQRLLTHHAIDAGDGTVIEFGQGEQTDEHGNVLKSTKNEIATASVQRNSMESFEAAAAAAGSSVQVVGYKKPKFTPDDVVARAESKLGERGYNPMTNNCEHFAKWCCIDSPWSRQVEAMEGVGAVVAVGGGRRPGP